jgi:hypothetical protein
MILINALNHIYYPKIWYSTEITKLFCQIANTVFENSKDDCSKRFCHLQFGSFSRCLQSNKKNVSSKYLNF